MPLQLNDIAHAAHNLKFCHMFDSKRIHCHQAEEEEKADKMEKKKQKNQKKENEKTEPKAKGRGKGMRRPAAASAASAPARGKRPLDVTPMAIPDPAKSPKKRQRKAKAVEDVAEEKVEKKGKKAPEAGGDSDEQKEKRRVRAAEGWVRLQEAKVPGLVMPEDLKGRISFTMKCPDGQGSSIGIILNAESYYIAKAVNYTLWPTDCTHLKVGSSTSTRIVFQLFL